MRAQKRSTVDRKRGWGETLSRLAAALVCGLALAPVSTAGAADDPGSSVAGFRATPSLAWSGGEHRLDLGLVSRWRAEWWDAHAPSTDGFYALRTRLGLRYAYGQRLTLYGELQDARLYSLSPASSGAGALYRRSAEGRDRSRTHSDRLRQLWLEVNPVERLSVRVGRQDILLGTEATYGEPHWKYVKVHRASQRLVGTVGWTHGERTNDGITVAYDGAGHHLYAFAARPTTGVFDVENAYTRQDEIDYGGVSWTVKRDTWIPDTELRFFGIAYDDDRPTRHGGLPEGVEVFTLGLSAIGFYSCGPGRADLLVWGAYQLGDFDGDDHAAAAGIVEVGYQLIDVPTKPWIRVGLNVASGDGDPEDGDHRTFFNLLPTNHLYYGFADQLAFQNLVDWFAQLMLKPLPKLSVNLMLHQFSLQNDDDAQYFGTGAFSRDLFGFGARPSRGHRSVATELDAVVDYALNPHVSVQGGYAYVWGRDVWNTFDDEDVKFGYVQLTFRY